MSSGLEPICGHSAGGSMTDSRALLTEAAAIADAAAELLAKATVAAPAVESRLKYLADVHNGKMVGLEWKLKPIASLMRKMSLGLARAKSLQEIVDAQYDVMRFTMLLPATDYVAGVKAVIKALVQQENCREIEVKNYWNCWTYKGVNCIFATSGGGANQSTPSVYESVKFEVQFHTPESFDNKQNQTHVLYETLRREEDPVKQNLFFLDMRSMWETVTIPDGINEIGQAKKQDIPARKTVTDAQQHVINQIWSLKAQVLDHIADLRRLLHDVDDNGARLCVEFAVAQFPGASVKDLDVRFRSALRVRRRVEESIRRRLHVRVSEHLHEIEMPTVIEGKSIRDFIATLVASQHDVLHYTVVVDEPENYTRTVLGVMDVLVRNGYALQTVQNFWGDLEKHHAIRALFSVDVNAVREKALCKAHRHAAPLSFCSPTRDQPASSPSVMPQCFREPNSVESGETNTSTTSDSSPSTSTLSHVLFSIEFHTKQSFDARIERANALQHVEYALYERGEPILKAAVDMQVRYDTRMLRRWATVRIPEHAEAVGFAATNDEPRSFEEGGSGALQADEPAQLPHWVTPQERHVRRRLGALVLKAAAAPALMAFPALLAYRRCAQRRSTESLWPWIVAVTEIVAAVSILRGVVKDVNSFSRHEW